MLAEVLTVLNIVNAVIDIWGRIKPSEKVRSAEAVAGAVEKTAQQEDVASVIQTLRQNSAERLDAEDAEQLIADVRFRWVFERLSNIMENEKGWSILKKPEFLLVAEKGTYMGSLQTGLYLIGFVTGPRTSAGVDAEFNRWVKWVSGRQGNPQALLVFAYDNLAGISADHILAKEESGGWLAGYTAKGGYLDLSQVRLAAHQDSMERLTEGYGPPTFWNAELDDALGRLRDEYLRISGYF